MTILDRLKAAIQEHYEKGGRPIVSVRCGHGAFPEISGAIKRRELGSVHRVSFSEPFGLAYDAFELVEAPRSPVASSDDPRCPTCGQRRLVSP